ncbi:glycoside hydrolase family 95 protein [Xylariaceae sp. FL1651]|nr:glycoside hydrolase family 95 protein [Xylariaceae sp. FL1651]
MARCFVTLLVAAATVLAQWDASRFAWYKPAATDFNSAGPIGNGRLGALVYGSAKEKIQLNENSVWNGLLTNRVNSKAKGALSSVRSQLMNGLISYANNNALPNVVGNPTSPQSYSVTAELEIDVGHKNTDSSYTRYVDTFTGSVWATYTYAGVNYTRKVVAGYPDQVLAMRYMAGIEGQLSATVDLVRNNQISKGSSITNNISVSGATTVNRFFDAESIYRYSDTNVCSTVASNRVNTASAVDGHTPLMNRVKLDLGISSNGNQPTDTRLSNYKSNPNADVQLPTPLFNFGHHHLIASSRDTGYTTNIEMNYWPAKPTNLAETHKALFDLLWTTKSRAEAMASDMYGCEGAVSHHNIDLWGDLAPTDNGTPHNLAYRPCLAVFTYHRALQFTENAFIINGGLSNNGVTAAIDISLQMDNNILWKAFQAIIETCSALSLFDSACTNTKSYITKLRPAGIGSYGQILEWRQKYGETEPGMRHFSPLFALHPDTQFAPLVNQTLANAASKLLENSMNHGSGDTGWSRAWAIALYARLFEGNSAWDKFNGPPMQIDGNFGFVSRITELLLQSHTNNIVHLLPALPSSIPTGSVTGLVACGGQLTSATIMSNLAKQLTISAQNGTTFNVNGATYTEPINTTQGSEYIVKVGIASGA